ncbi:nicotinate-nucleotide--dimethylbenzimidazole phosphoribosyltransferase [Haloglomus litoreum]|uniref:nicotinate-nucleotide--dimethylbenzimidazole phosphoribosyltransferase n=1 Tax=Haloglomus litoreum TaxID=3034026 RepID=UPI0023E7903D|nr:nicotinate-nucleotide--dimethylbenzimidazole phosphoribosyltransferase [Haloglomus sp. DT116]
MTRFVLVAGGTATARIDGISAAGADPALMAHTPSADAEILVHGEPTGAPVVPVSPSGCPTPAVVTRAVRECRPFDTAVVDAGLAAPTDAETTTVADDPGADIREPVAVPDAAAVVARAREHGRALADSAAEPSRLWLAETVPGGTTTAFGTLAALGEAAPVSSSLASNPLELKRRVVEAGLAASGIERGTHADDPVAAVRAMGDPTLAATLGLVQGATEAGADVTLAGGTQQATAALLARRAGVDAPLTVATTAFVARDGSAAFRALAAAADADVRVTDPSFDGHDHPAMRAYAAGEAKEGVGMGGALALAADAGVGMGAVRDQVRAVYDRLLADTDRPPATGSGTDTVRD